MIVIIYLLQSSPFISFEFLVFWLKLNIWVVLRKLHSPYEWLGLQTSEFWKPPTWAVLLPGEGDGRHRAQVKLAEPLNLLEVLIVDGDMALYVACHDKTVGCVLNSSSQEGCR